MMMLITTIPKIKCKGCGKQASEDYAPNEPKGGNLMKILRTVVLFALGAFLFAAYWLPTPIEAEALSWFGFSIICFTVFDLLREDKRT